MAGRTVHCVPHALVHVCLHVGYKQRGVTLVETLIRSVTLPSAMLLLYFGI